MQIIPRIIFGLIILGINLLITDLFPKTSFFSEYETDLKVLIPFLCLLFLQPFLELFNPFICKIKQVEKEENEDGTIDVDHAFKYSGREPLTIQITKVITHKYTVSSKILSLNKNFDTPEELVHFLTREHPFEIIKFHLIPKNENIDDKVIIYYKLNNLNKKIIIK